MHIVIEKKDSKKSNGCYSTKYSFCKCPHVSYQDKFEYLTPTGWHWFQHYYDNLESALLDLILHEPKCQSFIENGHNINTAAKLAYISFRNVMGAGNNVLSHEYYEYDLIISGFYGWIDDTTNTIGLYCKQVDKYLTPSGWQKDFYVFLKENAIEVLKALAKYNNFIWRKLSADIVEEIFADISNLYLIGANKWK